MTEYQVKLIDAGKASIEVFVTGEKGPLVVMLPSAGRGALDFDFLALQLSLANWRPAAVNPRGVGNSKGPLEEVTLHTYVEDVAEVVNALDGTPAVVIGHAWGNRVARCFAADYPDMVRCVVLLAAGGKVPMAPEAVKAFKRLGGRLTEEERLSALQTAFFAHASDPSAWKFGFWWESIKASRAATQSTPLADWWSGGEVPILVIQGKEDRCAPPENGHLLKHEYGDRITVIDIDRAGHALLPEQPELIAETIIDYLKNFRA